MGTWELLQAPNFLPNHSTTHTILRVLENSWVFFLQTWYIFGDLKIIYLHLFIFWVVNMYLISDADYLRSANYLFSFNFLFWAVNCFMISDAYYFKDLLLTLVSLKIFYCIPFIEFSQRIYCNISISQNYYCK